MTRIDEQPPVRLGIDTLLDDEIHRILGRRLGLVTSAASVDRRLRRTIDRLVQTPDINVTALFAPEQCLYAQAQAGASVPQSIDHPTGLTVYSLYGEYKQPPRDWLDDIDVIVVDLVDAGSRYWTFPYTMANVLKACAESSLEIIVLD